MVYWVKTNFFIKQSFLNYVWDLPNNDKKVYLTFDDGPTEVITKWVLDQLKIYNAKATFFCIGSNIETQPHIYKDIISQNHSIGNHTHNHLNGWTTKAKYYLENIELCENAQAISTKSSSKLFRPPYGKINFFTTSKIRKLGYKIIMWDILSADFDNKISNEQCLKNVLTNIQSGSIIVFHDSKKAFEHLKFVLPKVLDYLKENNFVCESIK